MALTNMEERRGGGGLVSGSRSLFSCAPRVLTAGLRWRQKEAPVRGPPVGSRSEMTLKDKILF